MKKAKELIMNIKGKVNVFCSGVVEFVSFVYSKRKNKHFAIKMTSLFAVLFLSFAGTFFVVNQVVENTGKLYGKVQEMNIVESIMDYVFNDNVDEEALEKRGLEIKEVQLEHGESFWLAQEKLDGYVDKGRYSQFLQLNQLNETDVLQPTAYKFVVSKK